MSGGGELLLKMRRICLGKLIKKWINMVDMSRMSMKYHPSMGCLPAADGFGAMTS